MTGNGYYVVLAKNVDSDIARDITSAQINGAAGRASRSSRHRSGSTRRRAARRTPRWPPSCWASSTPAASASTGWSSNTTPILAGQPEIGPGRPEHARDPPASTSSTQALPGQDIRTTIDASLQLQVEQEVFATWLADKAKTGVRDRHGPEDGRGAGGGELPARTTPTSYSDVANPEPGLFTDPIISDVYEPGSVFKLLTASAALQTGTTAADDQDQRHRRPEARR